MNYEHGFDAEILLELVENFILELKDLTRRRVPVQALSAERAAAINVVLSDIRRVLDETSGARYLGKLPEYDVVTVSETIFVLIPYRILLQKYFTYDLQGGE